MVPPSAKRGLQSPSARGWQDTPSAREPETCSAMNQQGGNSALMNYMPLHFAKQRHGTSQWACSPVVALTLEMHEQGIAVHLKAFSQCMCSLAIH